MFFYFHLNLKQICLRFMKLLNICKSKWNIHLQIFYQIFWSVLETSCICRRKLLFLVQGYLILNCKANHFKQVTLKKNTYCTLEQSYSKCHRFYSWSLHHHLVHILDHRRNTLLMSYHLTLILPFRWLGYSLWDMKLKCTAKYA